MLWVGHQNTIGRGSNTMCRGFDISWVYFVLCVCGEYFFLTNKHYLNFGNEIA